MLTMQYFAQRGATRQQNAKHHQTEGGGHGELAGAGEKDSEPWQASVSTLGTFTSLSSRVLMHAGVVVPVQFAHRAQIDCGRCTLHTVHGVVPETAF